MNETPALNNALARIQKMAGSNAPYGARVNAEQIYAQEYDTLVRRGLKPRLRAKYRVKA